MFRIKNNDCKDPMPTIKKTKFNNINMVYIYVKKYTATPTFGNIYVIGANSAIGIGNQSSNSLLTAQTGYQC